MADGIGGRKVDILLPEIDPMFSAVDRGGPGRPGLSHIEG